jgi:hypothetical protein
MFRRESYGWPSERPISTESGYFSQLPDERRRAEQCFLMSLNFSAPGTENCTRTPSTPQYRHAPGGLILGTPFGQQRQKQTSPQRQMASKRPCGHCDWFCEAQTCPSCGTRKTAIILEVHSYTCLFFYDIQSPVRGSRISLAPTDLAIWLRIAAVVSAS